MLTLLRWKIASAFIAIADRIAPSTPITDRILDAIEPTTCVMCGASPMPWRCIEDECDGAIAWRASRSASVPFFSPETLNLRSCAREQRAGASDTPDDLEPSISDLAEAEARAGPPAPATVA